MYSTREKWCLCVKYERGYIVSKLQLYIVFQTPITCRESMSISEGSYMYVVLRLDMCMNPEK